MPETPGEPEIELPAIELQDIELQDIELQDIELQEEHRFGTPRSGAKDKAIASARAVTGVLAVAVGAAAILAAALIPLPPVAVMPATVNVTPVSAAERIVCPGAMLRLGDASGQNASSAAPLGTPIISSAGAVTAAGAGGAGSLLETPDAGNTETGAPMLLFGPEDGGVGIAGSQSQAVDSGDYRGFAAAQCARPSSDLWLAGGSTALGRTTLLTLANPGAVVSNVTIEIYGESGLVEAPGTNGIVLAPNSQRVLSLAGFAPSVESIVVHVTSRGGPILANLQQSIVRGIDPGGLDIIGATAEPSTLNVIPGLVLVNAEEVQARLGEEGFADLASLLRVFVPGEQDGTATVRVVPETRDAAGASFELDLVAGVVTEIAMEGLTDGSYSVIVSTDVPAVAGLRASTMSGSGATDVAWLGSAAELPASAVVSIAPGPGAAIHLSNIGDAAARVSVTGSDGSVVAVDIQAGSAAALAAVGAVSYTIESSQPVYGSVSYAGPGQLASYIIGGAAAAQPVVVVYPG